MQSPAFHWLFPRAADDAGTFCQEAHSHHAAGAYQWPSGSLCKNTSYHTILYIIIYDYMNAFTSIKLLCKTGAS